MRGNNNRNCVCCMQADGMQAADNELLAAAQFEHVAHCLETPGMRSLIVGTEWPIVFDSPHRTRARAKSALDPELGGGANASDELLRSTWEYDPATQERLLRMLFDWRAGANAEEGEARDVVLVAGGLNVGVESLVRPQHEPEEEPAEVVALGRNTTASGEARRARVRPLARSLARPPRLVLSRSSTD